MSATPARDGIEDLEGADETVGRIDRHLEMPIRHCRDRLRQSLGAGAAARAISRAKLVTILSSLMPCAIAGAGKLAAAATAAVAPSSISRRRVFIVASRTECTAGCPALDFRPLSPDEARRQLELTGPYSLPNSRTRASGVGARLLIVIFGISAVSALVAGAAIYAFVEVGHSLDADRSPHRPDPGLARSVALGRAHRDRGLGAVRRHHRAETRRVSSPGFPANRPSCDLF